MPHHGDIDKDKKKVYCGYWMTIEEWGIYTQLQYT